MTAKEINAVTRAADGRNVYMIESSGLTHRVVRARVSRKALQIRDLATGRWMAVLDSDTIEVR